MVKPQLWLVHGVTSCAPLWELRWYPQGVVPHCVGTVRAGEAHMVIATVGVGVFQFRQVSVECWGAACQIGLGACLWEGTGVPSQACHEPDVLLSPTPGQLGIYSSGLAERSIIMGPGHPMPIMCCKIGNN